MGRRRKRSSSCKDQLTGRAVGNQATANGKNGPAPPLPRPIPQRVPPHGAGRPDAWNAVGCARVAARLGADGSGRDGQLSRDCAGLHGSGSTGREGPSQCRNRWASTSGGRPENLRWSGRAARAPCREPRRAHREAKQKRRLPSSGPQADPPTPAHRTISIVAATSVGTPVPVALDVFVEDSHLVGLFVRRWIDAAVETRALASTLLGWPSLDRSGV